MLCSVETAEGLSLWRVHLSEVGGGHLVACNLLISAPQERLQSLKQSIEFMADLENTKNEEGEPEKEGIPTLEQSKDSQVAMDTSETGQSPRRILRDTPRCWRILLFLVQYEY